MSSLVIAPAIAAALMAPSVAFAADGADAAQANTVGHGELTLCDDPFAIEDAGPTATVSETAVAAPDASVPCSAETGSGTDASYSIASTQEIAGDPNDASTAEAVEESSEPVQAEPSAEVPVAASVEKPRAVKRSLSAQSEPGSDSKGGMEVYDSHEADLTFMAGEGGTVASGTTAISGGSSSISEHFKDSLSGSSKGATAIAKDGYHFVHWIDVATGEVISTSVSYVPFQPEGGWPVAWTIKAVFARNIYVLELDPNGGFAGGGGGSSGTVRLEVPYGTNFRMPTNGSGAVSYAKAGNTLTGWDVIAFPMLKGATGSLSFSDGQVLTSTIENELVRRGLLVLDWSKGRVPSVTLYAQWVAGQATISYTANGGGAIIPGSGGSGSGSSSFTETFDALTGAHSDNTALIGPTGATAKANAHYHFTGWKASGSAVSMASEESSAPRLSSTTVERISYYVSSGESTKDYHSVSFVASFAPNTYVFKYGSNGGSGSVASKSISYGSSFTAASSGFNRDGYKLTGWNTATDGSGAALSLGAVVSSNTIDSLISTSQLADRDNAATTLFAQWEYVGNPYVKPTPVIDPVQPDDEDEEPSGITEVVTEAINNYFSNRQSYIDTRAIGVSDLESAATRVAENVQKSANKEEPGLLASSRSNGSDAVVVAYNATSGGGYTTGGGGEDESIFDQLMSPEGMREASTTVAAVAAVGTLMGLVGLGASVAGAAIVGAATIGTAGAVGLSTAADLAADLAAASAAAGGAGGAAAKRRRKDEEDESQESGDE